jgi:hypothetical protein
MKNEPGNANTEGTLGRFHKEDGVQDFTNLGCPGETSTSFIKGGCPAAPTNPPQLQLALGYLQAHAGQVSPVTLDIGSNDTLRDVNPSTCAINTTQFNADLATLNTNLTQIILPQLMEVAKLSPPAT